MVWWNVIKLNGDCPSRRWVLWRLTASLNTFNLSVFLFKLCCFKSLILSLIMKKCTSLWKNDPISRVMFNTFQTLSFIEWLFNFYVVSSIFQPYIPINFEIKIYKNDRTDKCKLVLQNIYLKSHQWSKVRRCFFWLWLALGNIKF